LLGVRCSAVHPVRQSERLRRCLFLSTANYLILATHSSTAVELCGSILFLTELCQAVEAGKLDIIDISLMSNDKCQINTF
jgi:hypothetical protein